MKNNFSQAWWSWLPTSQLKRTKDSFSPGKIMWEIHNVWIDNYIEHDEFQTLDNKSKIYLMSQYIIEQYIDPLLEHLDQDQESRDTIQNRDSSDRFTLIQDIIKQHLENLTISKEISKNLVSEFERALKKDNYNKSSAFKNHKSRETWNFIHWLLDGLTVWMMAINIAKNTFWEEKAFTELKSEIIKIRIQLAHVNINVFRYILQNIVDWDNLSAHFRDQVFEIIETKNWKKIIPKNAWLIEYEAQENNEATLFCPAAFWTSIEKLFEIMK